MVNSNLPGLYAANILNGLQERLMAAAIKCTAGNASCICSQAPAVEAKTQVYVVSASGIVTALMFANASRDACVNCA